MTMIGSSRYVTRLRERSVGEAVIQTEIPEPTGRAFVSLAHSDRLFLPLTNDELERYREMAELRSLEEGRHQHQDQSGRERTG
jgi:hypothetical protein